MKNGSLQRLDYILCLFKYSVRLPRLEHPCFDSRFDISERHGENGIPFRLQNTEPGREFRKRRISIRRYGERKALRIAQPASCSIDECRGKLDFKFREHQKKNLKGNILNNPF